MALFLDKVSLSFTEEDGSKFVQQNSHIAQSDATSTQSVLFQQIPLPL